MLSQVSFMEPGLFYAGKNLVGLCALNTCRKQQRASNVFTSCSLPIHAPVLPCCSSIHAVASLLYLWLCKGTCYNKVVREMRTGSFNSTAEFIAQKCTQTHPQVHITTITNSGGLPSEWWQKISSQVPSMFSILPQTLPLVWYFCLPPRHAGCLHLQRMANSSVIFLHLARCDCLIGFPNSVHASCSL